MAPSREPGRSRTTIVVLVLISVTIIALDTTGLGPVDSLKSGVATVFSPFRAVGDTVFGPFGDAFNGIFHREDLRQENDDLRREVEHLRAQQAQAQVAAAELQSIRDSLDLPDLGDIHATHAEVVSGPVSNFDRTVRINKGANAGIRVGMPVITTDGDETTVPPGALLVGRVVDVTFNTANVQLITDSGFRLGVKHVLSSDIGVATGRGEDLPLRVDVGLDAATEIHQGDYFTTSGVDHSLFPPGLTVGRATEAVAASAPATTDGSAPTTTTATTAPERSLEQTIDIRPAADLDHLQFVSVMFWPTGG